jgi:hypothetical protein
LLSVKVCLFVCFCLFVGLCLMGISLIETKAKKPKKCHHRQLMSADAVEFCQL